MCFLLRIHGDSAHDTHTHTHTRWETKGTIICLAFSETLRGALADNTQTSCLCVCIKYLFETQDLCPLCITTKGKERLSRTMCNCKVCTDAITVWIEVVATESSAKIRPGGGGLELDGDISDFCCGENKIFALLGFCAA